MKTSIKKRILCAVVAFCMILSTAIYSTPVYASTNSTFLDAVAEVHAEKGYSSTGDPDPAVFVLDLSGKEIIGEIDDQDIIDLKTDYPNLMTVNVSNTYVTRVSSNVSGINVISNNTIASGGKTIVNDNEAMIRRLDINNQDIDIDELISKISISPAINGGLKPVSDICEPITYEVVNSGNVVEIGPSSTNITQSDLDAIGKGEYKIKFWLEYQNDSTTVTYVNVNLSIRDAEIILTHDNSQSDVEIYEGTPLTFYVGRVDGNGAVENILHGDVVNYTVNASSFNYTKAEEGGKLKIETDPLTAGSHSISVTDSANRSTNVIDIYVDPIPSITSVSLSEVNGTTTVPDVITNSITPSGIVGVDTIYVKRGTATASKEMIKVSNGGSYSGTTDFTLAGPEIDPGLFSSVNVTSTDTDKVQASKHLVGNDIVIRLAALAGAVNGSTSDITISIGSVAVLSFKAEVVPADADAYEIYQVPNNSTYNNMPAQQLEAILDTDSNINLVSRYEYNPMNGQYTSDGISRNAVVLENSSTRLFVVAEFGGEKVVVPYGTIERWYVDSSTTITTAEHDFGNGFKAKMLNSNGVDSLLVITDNIAAGEDIRVHPVIPNPNGPWPEVNVNIIAEAKELKEYLFVEENFSMPNDRKYSSSLNIKDGDDISIGTKKSYKVIARYNNDDIEFVNLQNIDFSIDNENFTISTSGYILTVKATEHGGVDDSKEGDSSVITYKGDAEFEATLDQSKIKGIMSYIQTPKGIFEKNPDGTKGNEIRKYVSSNTEVKIPRGLESDVYLRPIFTNLDMNNNINIDYSNDDYRLAPTLFSFEEANNKLIATDDTINKGEKVKANVNTTNQIPIFDELLNLDIRYISSIPLTDITIASNGNVYDVADNSELVSGGTVSLNSTAMFKIVKPIITGIDVEEFTGNTTFAVSSDLEGKEGEALTLRVKVRYSDGIDLDEIRTLPSGSGFADGILFTKDTPSTYDFTQGPSVPTVGDIYTVDYNELDVLRSYYFSEKPGQYASMTQTGQWNGGYSNTKVVSDITGLSEEISIGITNAAEQKSTNTGAYAFGYTIDGRKQNYPGFYTVNLLESNTTPDKVEFNASYSGNNINVDKLWIPNISAGPAALHNSIDLTVNEPEIEKVYFVTDGASRQSTGEYLFNRGNAPDWNTEFYVYPVILDTNWHLENSDATQLPEKLDFNDVGKVGINFITTDNFEDIEDGWIETDIPGIQYTPTIKNGRYCLKVAVIVDVARVNAESIAFDVSHLNQITSPAKGYDIPPTLADPDAFEFYAMSELLVKSIRYDNDGVSVVNVGEDIYFEIKYLLEDSITEIALKDKEIPGGVGYVADETNALIVTQVGGPIDGSSVTIGGTSTLKFTPKSIGEYKYKLTTKNKVGAIKPESEEIIITFDSKADMQTSYVLNYGEAAQVVCNLGTGVTPIYELQTGSNLDQSLIDSGVLIMIENEGGTETVTVKDSNGNVYGTFTVTMNDLSFTSSLEPSTTNVTVGPGYNNYPLKEKIVYDNGTVIEYKNLTSFENADAYGQLDNFLVYDSTNGLVSIIGTPEDGAHAAYKITLTNGTVIYYLATYDAGLQSPAYVSENLQLVDGTQAVTSVNIQVDASMPQKTLRVKVAGTGAAPTQMYEVVGNTSNIWAVTDSSHNIKIYASDAGTATLQLKNVSTGDIVATLTVNAIGGTITTYDITGTVTDGTVPIEDATVTIGTITTNTNSSGQYVIDGLEGGAYTATVVKSGYDTLTQNITVSASQTVHNFVLTASTVPLYNITGTVTDGTTPIQGVTVTIGTVTDITDANGNYAINGLAGGEHTATVVRSGYDTLTQNITVSASQTVHNFALIASTVPTYNITGKVTDGTNTIVGAKVATGNNVVYTDANGDYTLTGLAVGTHNVVVSMNGYDTVTVSVQVSANVVKNFVLSATNSGGTGGTGGSGGSGGGAPSGGGSSQQTDVECIITLEPKTIEIGEKSKASVKVYKGSDEVDLTSKAVYTWTISDKDAAEIDNPSKVSVNIVGLKEGTITVKVAIKDGNDEYTGTAKLTVNKVVSTTPKFTDVDSGFWGYEAIEYLVNNGIMAGYPNGTFAPNNAITRNEFAVVTARAMGWTTVTEEDIANAEAHFADWNSVPSWAKDAWAAVYKQGVMLGTLNESIYTTEASRDISRQEVCVVFSRLINNDVKAELTFKDNDKIAEWAKESVQICIGSNVISGFEDNTMRPLNSTTRAQIASMFYRYLTN